MLTDPYDSIINDCKIIYQKSGLVAVDVSLISQLPAIKNGDQGLHWPLCAQRAAHTAYVLSFVDISLSHDNKTHLFFVVRNATIIVLYQDGSHDSSFNMGESTVHSPP